MQKYPEFLIDYAEENELELVDVVEDNYKDGVCLLAIFMGEYGQEIKRIDVEEEIVYEN